MFRRFKDVVQNIYDVFTLVALLAIWTCATRKLADSNAIDIARSAGKVNRLFGNLWGATAGPMDHKHPLSGCSIQPLKVA